jgi:hypothetical protein
VVNVVRRNAGFCPNRTQRDFFYCRRSRAGLPARTPRCVFRHQCHDSIGISGERLNLLWERRTNVRALKELPDVRQVHRFRCCRRGRLEFGGGRFDHRAVWWRSTPPSQGRFRSRLLCGESFERGVDNSRCGKTSSGRFEADRYGAAVRAFFRARIDGYENAGGSGGQSRCRRRSLASSVRSSGASRNPARHCVQDRLNEL